VGGEIFHTRPHRPWGPPSLLYDRYRRIPGGKAAGACHKPPSTIYCRVSRKSRAICLCSPSGPSWPVLGWPLPLPNPSSVAVQYELTRRKLVRVYRGADKSLARSGRKQAAATKV